MATIVGTNDKDSLFGTDEDDILHGLDSPDVLEGLKGADLLDGATGSDTAAYSSAGSAVAVDLVTGETWGLHAAGDVFVSIENLSGTRFDDTFAGDDGANILSGGDGNDILRGRGGADRLDGGAGIDIATYLNAATGVVVNLTTGLGTAGDADGDVLSSIETLHGSHHEDDLTGSAGDDTLRGFGGNDRLEGGAGADLLDGATGSDTAAYSSAGSAVAVDLVTGETWGLHAAGDVFVSIENLSGTRFDDTFAGDDGANILSGGDGNDILRGRGGADRLDGGAGIDIATYLNAATGVVVNLTTGLGTAGDADGDVLSSIETLHGSHHEDDLTGSAGDDTLRGFGGNDRLEGGAGADLLDGATGSDTAAYSSAGSAVAVDLVTGETWGLHAAGDVFVSIENLSGTRFDDTFAGDDGANILSGGDGNDILRGRGGADRLDGGAGIDIATYLNAATGVVVNLTTGLGTAGDADGDVLSSIETLHGSHHEDDLTGSAGDDTLRGFGGNDRLEGGAGADLLDGATGSDTAAYSSAGSAVAVDLVTGETWGLHAAGDVFVSIENLSGTRFDDTFAGDDGANILSGGDGNDILRGRGGADRLDGGAGNDTASYHDAETSVSVDLLTTRREGTDAIGDIFLSIENLKGGRFDDTLVGDEGNNVLSGGDGDDRLVGRGGADQLNGGDGIDTADYRHHQHAIIGGRTGISERLTGELDLLSSIEIINGSAFDDLLWNVGFDGTDRVLHEIHGLDGNDFLMDGVDDGVDTTENHSTIFDGGNGTDWIQYVSAADSLKIDLASGTGSGDIADGDLYISIENVIIAPRRITSTENGKIVTTLRTTDDIVIGDDQANQIDGGGGRDDIRGGGGDDYLIGRTGTTRYDGGDGLDTVDYGLGYSGGDGVVVSLETGKGSGGLARGHSYQSIEAIIGTTADDVLVGDDRDNLMTGGAGADILTGGLGSDTIIYTGSAITIDLAAGRGSRGDAAGDVLSGIENVIGTAADDHLSGDAGVNVFTGRAGDDKLYGRAGDDVLNGGTGGDILDGGAGQDTANYRDSTQAVRVNLLTATVAGGDAEGDLLSSIENLIGSSLNDQLIGDSSANVLTGIDGADRLEGGDGDDVLIGGSGADALIGGSGSDTASYDDADAAVTVSLATGSGSAGEGKGDVLLSIEILSGSRFADTFIGSSGDDTLSGNNGDDVLNGGAGDDSLLGGKGADRITGGGGVDVALYDGSAAAVAIDLASGSAEGGDAAGDILTGIESLRGSAFDDLLSGDSLSNLLTGSGGNDHLRGRAGDDILIGGTGRDILDGGSGTDVARYSDATSGIAVNLATGRGTEGDADGDVLSDIENLEGSNFADHLIGNEADNLLLGGEGDDILDGGDGDDVLFGGRGADHFIGGSGQDTVTYEAASSEVKVDLAVGAPEGDEAAGDTFEGIEDLTGSRFSDHLAGDEGTNLLFGGEGDDLLSGAGGDDIMIGGGGADRMIGGAGIDRASYTQSSAAVTVDLSTGRGSGGDAAGDLLSEIESVEGSSFADRLSGGAADDVLNGAEGNDSLTGGEGDDALIGGAGADILQGGKGNDTVFYDNSTAAVVVDLAAGTANGGHATGDTLADIEGLSGSIFADRLTGSDVSNTLVGGMGDDVLDAGAGDDALIGGTGKDTLSGGNGTDRAIYAASSEAVIINLDTGSASGGDAAGDILSGIEGLEGSAFADHLSGDQGSNSLVGNAGDDILSGQGGDDALAGGGGADRLDGGSGQDTVLYTTSAAGVTVDLNLGGIVTGGDAHGDILSGIENVIGSAFDDVLTGDSADNALVGNEGDDLLSGGEGADYLDGGDGIDAVTFATETSDLIIDLAIGIGQGGSAENDRLISIEKVISGSGNDILSGTRGDGVDHLAAGGGNDQLDGGGGADVLTGGAGADRFLYDKVADSRADRADIITDFSATEDDLIDLSAVDAVDGRVGNQAFTFIGTSNFSKTHGELRIVVNDGQTFVEGDVNGDGTADLRIILAGVTIALTTSDFLF